MKSIDENHRVAANGTDGFKILPVELGFDRIFFARGKGGDLLRHIILSETYRPYTNLLSSALKIALAAV